LIGDKIRVAAAILVDYYDRESVATSILHRNITGFARIPDESIPAMAVRKTR
jgi:hypothetical protein